MIEQIAIREADFKSALQYAEIKIMEGFAFKQQLRLGGIDSGVYASSTLNETLSLVEDYLVINYDT
jgi:hypothetical protein